MSHDGAGGMRWLLTYADLITLLLVFFIIAYAAANKETPESRAMAASISEAFSPLSNDNPFIAEGKGYGKNILSHGRTANLLGAPTLVSQVRDAVLLLENRSAMIRFLSEQLVVDVMPENIFEPDGVTIRESARPFLKRMSDISMSVSKHLQIAAYRPEKMPEGYAATDVWTLTARESSRVADYMTTLGNVDASRVTALALGSNTDRVGIKSGAGTMAGISFVFLDVKEEEVKDLRQNGP